MSEFNRVQPSPRTKFFNSMREACIAIGVDDSRPPRGNGRADLMNDSHGRGDASIRRHSDGRGGSVFNHKTGDCAIWRDDAGERLSPEESKRRKAEAFKRMEAERAAANEAAMFAHDTALYCRMLGRETVEHAYLKRKHIAGGRPFLEADSSEINSLLADRGYRSDSTGRLLRLATRDGLITGPVLLIPMVIGAQLVTMEFISESGSKCFLKGGPTKGAYWLSRPASEYETPPRIAIAEGVATALSVDLATGTPSIAAMSAGNLEPVAAYWRRRLPYADIVICSDIGNGERQAMEAASAARARLAKPEFTPELKAAFEAITGGNNPTDMNDYYIAKGTI